MRRAYDGGRRRRSRGLVRRRSARTPRIADRDSRSDHRPRGVLVAIPGLFATALVRATGATIGFLAIADRLVGHGDGWFAALVVAAINGGLALTGIGGIVSFCVGAAGFGAVIRDWLE